MDGNDNPNLQHAPVAMAPIQNVGTPASSSGKSSAIAPVATPPDFRAAAVTESAREEAQHEQQSTRKKTHRSSSDFDNAFEAPDEDMETDEEQQEDEDTKVAAVQEEEEDEEAIASKQSAEARQAASEMIFLRPRTTNDWLIFNNESTALMKAGDEYLQKLMEKKTGAASSGEGGELNG